MQGSQREKLNRRIDMRWMTGRHQRNTVGQGCGSEMCVIRQAGCFAGQTWLETLGGTGRWDNSEYRSCHNNQ
uniref:Uncharacterized protein n=1 Tax=Romanomermis culicivorax TaxID=13658 RepID=A0A915JU03_ROMCU